MAGTPGGSSSCSTGYAAAGSDRHRAGPWDGHANGRIRPRPAVLGRGHLLRCDAAAALDAMMAAHLVGEAVRRFGGCGPTPTSTAGTIQPGHVSTDRSPSRGIGVSASRGRRCRVGAVRQRQQAGTSMRLRKPDRRGVLPCRAHPRRAHRSPPSGSPPRADSLQRPRALCRFLLTEQRAGSIRRRKHPC